MHIVVATDLSEGSESAARWAFNYARQLDARDREVELTVCHAAHARYPQVLDTDVRLDDPRNLERLSEEVDRWVREVASVDSLEFDVAIVPGEPDRVLVETVEQKDADWLAVGQTGRGAIAKFMIGSTSETLAHGPPCNLAICHSKTEQLDEPTFAVGIDFTEASARALQMAAETTRQLDGLLHVLHVVEPPTYEAYPFDTFGEGEVRDMNALIEKMQEELDFFLDEHADLLEGTDWMSETLTGYPTREIVQYAEDEELDGIHLGTAGRSAIGDFFIGSVSRGVVKHMPCTVYLAPPVD